eukprot:361994-Chlamydomonas_euryale.AAC.7
MAASASSREGALCSLEDGTYLVRRLWVRFLRPSPGTKANTLPVLSTTAFAGVEPVITSCQGETPCPDGPYYYCTGGKAHNRCRPAHQRAFAYEDCHEQCMSMGVVGYCEDEAPCPDGVFYHCLEGNTCDACRAIDDGYFPEVDCARQCVSVKNVGVCKKETPCPHGAYHYCMEGKAHNGCRTVDEGFFPEVDCSNQCIAVKDSAKGFLPKASPAPLLKHRYPSPPPPRVTHVIYFCEVETPCPGGPYFYCTNGKAYGGCRAEHELAFPSEDCNQQCMSV